MTVLNPTEYVLRDVQRERERQDAKWGEQHWPDGTGHQHYKSVAEGHKRVNDERAKNGNPLWSHILLEEVYEALAESDPVKLRAELVQVAAVAAVWIEDIDGRKA